MDNDDTAGDDTAGTAPGGVDPPGDDAARAGDIVRAPVDAPADGTRTFWLDATRAVPETVDEASRTVEVAFATDTPVRRRRWRDGRREEYREVLDVAGADLERMNAGVAPLLSDHAGWTVRAQLGVVESARIENGAAVARVRFASDEAGAWAFRRVKEGSLRGVSVGYAVHERRETADARTGETTVTIVRWEPYEVSLVAIPADPRAQIRSAELSESDMDEDSNAVDRTAGNETPANEVEDARAAPGGAVASGTSPDRPAPSEAPSEAPSDAAHDRIRAEERARISGIEDAARKLRIDTADKAVRALIDGGTDLDAARSGLIDLADKRAGGTFDPERGAPAVVSAPTTSNFGRFVRALAAAKGDYGRGVAICEDWGDRHIRAMTAGAFAAGGAFVPEQYVTEVIELLRNRTAVRRAGARVIPMPGGASSTYGAESQDIAASTLETGQLLLSAKKLRSLVPVSNTLIRTASPMMDEVVRNDMLDSMTVTEDLKFLRGDGSAGTPKGLLHWTHADHKFDAATDNTIASISTDLGRAAQRLADANIPMTAPAWLMSNRTAIHLANLRTANGEKAFPEMDQNATLRGYPFHKTGQIPNNLGDAGTASEIYFGDFAQAIIGETLQLEIEVSSQASYLDPATGGLVSAYSRDETVIRGICEHDFGPRYARAFAMIEAVTWGA